MVCFWLVKYVGRDKVPCVFSIGNIVINKQRRNFKDFMVVNREDSSIRPCDILPLCSHAADHDFKPASAIYFLKALQAYLLLEVIFLPPPVEIVQADRIDYSIEGIPFSHGATETETSADYMIMIAAFGAFESVSAVKETPAYTML